MLPKTGKSFPKSRAKLTEAEFAEVMASALQLELGEARHAAKTITRWTGVSVRTAKNWLSATHAPSGAHLALLAKRSDLILLTFLALAERPAGALTIDLKHLRATLWSSIEAIDAALDSIDGG